VHMAFHLPYVYGWLYDKTMQRRCTYCQHIYYNV
jgi:hypothetical protein